MFRTGRTYFIQVQFTLKTLLLDITCSECFYTIVLVAMYVERFVDICSNKISFCLLFVLILHRQYITML